MNVSRRGVAGYTWDAVGQWKRLRQVAGWCGRCRGYTRYTSDLVHKHCLFFQKFTVRPHAPHPPTHMYCKLHAPHTHTFSSGCRWPPLGLMPSALKL